ncbi:MAG: DUF6502 family protein [Woeseiaceae bacterium]|nr:DUF6502 family protein [Woeseiaceae bacterium]
MSEDVQQNLRLALRMLLKPLVRLLISQGVTHTDLSNAAKEVYVEMAIRHFMDTEKINQSRIAVITGLTRKEVRRVLDKAQDRSRADEGFSRPGRLLAGWHSDPNFIGPYGVPLELPYDAGPDEKRSFKQLVKIYGADMSPKAMLDILMSSGAVVEAEQGLYRAVRRSFEPTALSPELLERFGYVAHDFFSTAARNIERQAASEKLLERVVRADRSLSQAAINRLSEYLKENGQFFLEQIDNWIGALSDDAAGEETFNTGLGIYHYVESPADKTSLNELLVERGIEFEDKDKSDN